ncbi:hypothetical protein HK104_003274 [Borealophlyctis nickersoniae]|nr:hypothetical protein HK104_003274 [Borealophlyctis nickersoniae]
MTATVKHRTDFPPKWEYHTIENPDTALLNYVHPKLATRVDKDVKALLEECRRGLGGVNYYHATPQRLGLETTTFGPWGPQRGEDKWYFKVCTVKAHVVSRGWLSTTWTVVVKLEFARALPFPPVREVKG